jgi:site-specific DNA-methyltransferase (adenine-specific)
LLKNYAKEGFKILDTHLGSGSIAIACHYAGLDLTASEISKINSILSNNKIKYQF